MKPALGKAALPLICITFGVPSALAGRWEAAAPGGGAGTRVTPAATAFGLRVIRATAGGKVHG